VTSPAVSFVIPARNEARTLDNTIASIERAFDGSKAPEIIVVDHASTDDTSAIAWGRKAKVIHEVVGPVGRLRNVGAEHATCDILVFLDADVRVTDDWRTHLPVALHQVAAFPRSVTGSMVGISEQPSWIERHWFCGLRTRGRYLGSAHMILRRDFFSELGGFDENLETGEDHELCERVRKVGGQILPIRDLAVVHEGFPKTLAEFVERERWHGLGDFASWPRILGSRIAVGTLFFLLWHLTFVVAVLSGGHILAAASVGVLLLACLLFALRRLRIQGPDHLAVAVFLSYMYFVGRSLSLFQSLRRRLRRQS